MVTQAPLTTLAAKNRAIDNKVGLVCKAPHSTDNGRLPFEKQRTTEKLCPLRILL